MRWSSYGICRITSLHALPQGIQKPVKSSRYHSRRTAPLHLPLEAQQELFRYGTHYLMLRLHKDTQDSTVRASPEHKGSRLSLFTHLTVNQELHASKRHREGLTIG